MCPSVDPRVTCAHQLIPGLHVPIRVSLRGEFAHIDLFVFPLECSSCGINSRPKFNRLLAPLEQFLNGDLASIIVSTWTCCF